MFVFVTTTNKIKQRIFIRTVIITNKRQPLTGCGVALDADVEETLNRSSL